jgi:hypothetical protein
VPRRTFQYIKSSEKDHRHLYVDSKNASVIFAFLESDAQRTKKFRHNIDLVLNHKYTNDVFEHEPVDDETIGVYAFKLKVGINPRIYCKTYETESGFHIILVELVTHKASQKLTKPLKTIIRKVATYEYEIE